MAGSGSGSRSQSMALARGDMSVKVILSYAFDWVVIIALGVVAAVLGVIEPNKRPFSLNDPGISFPYTETETVPLWLLIVLVVVFPAAVVLVVSLIFVPGATVPKNTPFVLVWKRKLWELHVGLLGLALSLAASFFFTQGMKNMFGKPRPDLLDRCDPNLQNAQDHVVGGFSGENPLGLLYSASICQQSDSEKLDDGFRSYPSGHSSSAAGGLVYLSLFLASKFVVTIPFVVHSSAQNSASALAAFPSRMPTGASDGPWDDGSAASSPVNAKAAPGQARHNAKLQSLRRQAAAPPLYLLVITLAPFCLSIFIAASRWFDFRHHGFDILFGYIMGLITAIYSFRYYHLPIQEGAGWAWGPRGSDRAFWAGVGRMGYAGDKGPDLPARPHAHLAQSNDVELQPDVDGPARMTQRPTNGSYRHEQPYASNGANPPSDRYASNAYRGADYDDVEMHSMDQRLGGHR